MARLTGIFMSASQFPLGMYRRRGQGANYQLVYRDVPDHNGNLNAIFLDDNNEPRIFPMQYLADCEFVRVTG